MSTEKNVLAKMFTNVLNMGLSSELKKQFI